MERRNIKKLLKRAGDEALGLVFPENINCICCGDSMESTRVHGLCDECCKRIDWNISDPFERDLDRFSFDGILRCCVYGFYPRQIIRNFKLKGNPYAARPLGKLMGERLYMSGQKPDIIAAVPMHKSKLKKRGFNQSELLAKYAAEEYERLSGRKINYIKDLLIKKEATRSMRLSGGNERRLISHTTFSLSSQYADIIEVSNIVLADDVLTTGSTADACSRILKEAGAGNVYILCFAGPSGYIPQEERRN